MSGHELKAPFELILSAPVFALGVRWVGNQLMSLEFLPPQDEVLESDALLAETLRHQFSIWLNTPSYVFSLPLLSQGTAFQQKVWREIAAIPYGSTRTYGELARCLNTAPRPVGGACGSNPFPVLVPCHRVVARSGGLGGGLGGFARARGGFLLEVKAWLLRRERDSA